MTIDPSNPSDPHHEEYLDMLQSSELVDILDAEYTNPLVAITDKFKIPYDGFSNDVECRCGYFIVQFVNCNDGSVDLFYQDPSNDYSGAKINFTQEQLLKVDSHYLHAFLVNVNSSLIIAKEQFFR